MRVLFFLSYASALNKLKYEHRGHITHTSHYIIFYGYVNVHFTNQVISYNFQKKPRPAIGGPKLLGVMRLGQPGLNGDLIGII